MDAADDYALRKAQRQMGPHGHYIMVGIVLVWITIIRWIGTPPPPPAPAPEAKDNAPQVTSP